MQQDIAHDVLLIRAAIVGEVVTEKRDDQTDALPATCANVNVAGCFVCSATAAGRSFMARTRPAMSVFSV